MRCDAYFQSGPDKQMNENKISLYFHFLAFRSIAQLAIVESSCVQRLDVQTWNVAAERCEHLVVGGRTERETRSVCGRCVFRGISARSSKSKVYSHKGKADQCEQK